MMHPQWWEGFCHSSWWAFRCVARMLASISFSTPTPSAKVEERWLSGGHSSLQLQTKNDSRLLLEMNHEVRGEARQESVDQVKKKNIFPPQCPVKVLNSDPEFFSRFQLVIVCGLPEKTLATVSSLCWQVGFDPLDLWSTTFLGQCPSHGRAVLRVSCLPQTPNQGSKHYVHLSHLIVY